MAILPLLYKKTLEKKVAMAEMLVGLGYMGGPLVGGVCADIGGESFGT